MCNAPAARGTPAQTVAAPGTGAAASDGCSRSRRSGAPSLPAAPGVCGNRDCRQMDAWHIHVNYSLHWAQDDRLRRNRNCNRHRRQRHQHHAQHCHQHNCRRRCSTSGKTSTTTTTTKRRMAHENVLSNGWGRCGGGMWVQQCEVVMGGDCNRERDRSDTRSAVGAAGGLVQMARWE